MARTGVLLLTPILFLSACGDTDTQPLGGGDAGASSDLGASDTGLLDVGSEAGLACDARTALDCAEGPNCTLVQCDRCGESVGFCMEAAEAPSFACPDVMCPPCSSFDEPTCFGHSECHGLYREEGICDCAEPGCCMIFQRCDNPGSVNCDASGVTCRAPPPVCGEGFEAEVRGNCWGDCVRTQRCR